MAHDTIWCVCCVDDKGAYTYEPQDKKELAQLFTEYDEIVAHNGIGFDFPVLAELWGIVIPDEKQRDTLVLSRLYNPQITGRHALRAWGERLGKTQKGDFTDFDGGLSEEMIEYCLDDTQLLKELDVHLDKCFTKWKDVQKASKIEHEVARIMRRQTLTGFKLDEPYAVELLGTLTHRMMIIEQELQAVFPPIVSERISEKTGKRLKDGVEVFNVGSRRQIERRLTSLGAKFTKKTEGGTFIVDEPVLEAIDLPEAKLCLEYLTIQKRVGMLTSWLDKLGEDGRVHGRVMTNGAVTGRMTHNSPNLGQVAGVTYSDEGVPLEGADGAYGVESRKCWTVEKGNKLVGCDLSGIELRCLAHYMQDDEWTHELLNGDIHTKNQLAAGLDTRAQAKTMIYATLYGAGVVKIGSIVGGGRARGKEILDNFYKNTPALMKLKEKVGRIAESGGITGLDGRRLIVRSEHAALNTLLQGCGAIIAKQWIVDIQVALKNFGLAKHCKQVVMVHDEVQFECEEAYADQLGKVLAAAAQTAGETLGMRVPVEAEYKIGDTWYDTH